MERSKTPRPEVFISATSQDLGACRQMIGCTPVEQTNFAPDSRSVREMLRRILAHCDAVVHVVGLRYGAEPQVRTDGEPRRSYTQLEYDMARELGIPVYVFLCGAGFPYAPCEPESELLQELQLLHRSALLGGDEVYEQVSSMDALQVRIHALQARVERLAAELSRTRSWLGRGLVMGIALLSGLGGGLWWLSGRTDQAESRLEVMETELAVQRAYIRNSATAYLEVKTQLADLQLTDEELWLRAIERTASDAGLPATELQAAIELFVAVVGQQGTASPLDRAYAQFAQGEFSAAADLAVLASEDLQRQRLASRDLVANALRAEAKIRAEQREAYRFSAQARMASGQYAAGVAAYQAALSPEITDRSAEPEVWVELQHVLALASFGWGQASEGAAIVQHLNEALQAYRLALEVCTRESSPLEWADIHSDLAVAYEVLAKSYEGEERARAFAAAESSLRSSLEVFTRESHPYRWAKVKMNLSIFLRNRMKSAQGEGHRRLLEDSVALLQEVLDQVVTRESSPDQWATAQGQLGNAYAELAQLAQGEERLRLLQESVEAIRLALELETHETAPKRWAMKQNNLALSLSGLARELPVEQGMQMLNEAFEAYASVLEVETRAANPQVWAATQLNLAATRQEQAILSDGDDRSRYLADAINATRAALEVFTRESLPLKWAGGMGNLGAVLSEHALSIEEGEEQSRLFAESDEAYLLSLEVYTKDAFPGDWARVQINRGIGRRHRATYSEGRQRFDFLQQSADAFRQALLVVTRENAAQGWAWTLANLCDTLISQADGCQGEERARILREAVEAMKQVVLVWNEQDAPDDYYPRQAWIEATEAELAGGM
jgi:uncharacterized small protein (DUF1192 family)